jgi:hypothetical protein
MPFPSPAYHLAATMLVASPFRLSPALPPERPTLIVMITVDQMIPEYFDRCGREFTGGSTTEDIGPTLAALAGVRPTEAVSGRVLPEITGPARK